MSATTAAVPASSGAAEAPKEVAPVKVDAPEKERDTTAGHKRRRAVLDGDLDEEEGVPTGSAPPSDDDATDGSKVSESERIAALMRELEEARREAARAKAEAAEARARGKSSSSSGGKRAVEAEPAPPEKPWGMTREQRAALIAKAGTVLEEAEAKWAGHAERFYEHFDEREDRQKKHAAGVAEAGIWARTYGTIGYNMACPFKETVGGGRAARIGRGPNPDPEEVAAAEAKAYAPLMLRRIQYARFWHDTMVRFNEQFEPPANDRGRLYRPNVELISARQADTVASAHPDIGLAVIGPDGMALAKERERQRRKEKEREGTRGRGSASSSSSSRRARTASSSSSPSGAGGEADDDDEGEADGAPSAKRRRADGAPTSRRSGSSSKRVRSLRDFINDEASADDDYDEEDDEEDLDDDDEEGEDLGEEVEEEEEEEEERSRGRRQRSNDRASGKSARPSAAGGIRGALAKAARREH
jgi:hypothetical protein